MAQCPPEQLASRFWMEIFSANMDCAEWINDAGNF
jgi:hypothetical protein